MIVSCALLPSKEFLPSPALIQGLEVGQILTGRVVQPRANGSGVLRFSDGSGFNYANGPSLKPGEPVQVQVLRLVPEVAFRLLSSSSGVAAGLAESLEQSLVRAPDIFSNLLNWSGMASGGKSGVLGEGVLSGFGAGVKADTLITLKGFTLAHMLHKILPTVSAHALLRGDLAGLVRLLEGGSRQNVRAMIHQLRQLAEDLYRPPTASTEKSASEQGRARQADVLSDVNVVRNTLYRLGDLLAMQELLPRTPLSLDGGQLLGYRVFWLAEGGMGEVIWQQEREKKRREQEEDTATAVTTVLLSLNMTGLGAVQARVSYGEGLCYIRIAAEDEEALAALRIRIRELRSALLAEELPLRSLDLSRLMPGEMKEERMKSLGLASHFSTEA